MLYADDCLEDGEKDDIGWLSNRLGGRSNCKDLEYPSPKFDLDHIGITYSKDDMSVYIKKCLKALGWGHLKLASAPIDAPIDVDSPALSPEKHKKAVIALEMFGWLSLTVRCDVSFGQSHVAQHQSKLNESCYLAI